MLIAITRRDKPGSHDLRAQTQEAHEVHLKQFMDAITFGGELVSDGTMSQNRDIVIADLVGSVLIMELPDRAAAQAFHDQDPYTLAGLFESVIIEEFNQRKPAP